MSGPLQQWKKATLKDLGQIASEMKELVSPPAVVIFTGELGVGKTTFLKHFTEDDNLTSPSYSLVNEGEDYIHADFYRLEKASDIESLELEFITQDKEYVFVEWGGEYIPFLKRLLGNDFSFYELLIGVNSVSEESNSIATRNFQLFQRED